MTWIEKFNCSYVFSIYTICTYLENSKDKLDTIKILKGQTNQTADKQSKNTMYLKLPFHESMKYSKSR